MKSKKERRVKIAIENDQLKGYKENIWKSVVYSCLFYN